MPYDIFISYSRRDNEQGRITQLVERLQRDFAPFANRACCSPVFLRRISGASIASGSLSNTSNTRSAICTASMASRRFILSKCPAGTTRTSTRSAPRRLPNSADGQPQVGRVHRLLHAMVKQALSNDKFKDSVLNYVKNRLSALHLGQWQLLENLWEIDALRYFAEQLLDEDQDAY